MEPLTVAPEIIEFYTTGYDEASRLSTKAHGLLEKIRTQELLRRHLPEPPAGVLDVGGGPGAHARWLAADGYRVHLVDPVERHLEEAAATGSCSVERGDARHLTASDASYDVVLLLGPLYHLVDPAERLQALREARRSVRPGGLVAVAAISRNAALLEKAALGRLDGPTRPRVDSILATGHHDPTFGFTTAYFHTVEGLRAEMSDAGLADVSISGVEGPVWPSLVALEAHTGDTLADSAHLASALTAARMVDSDPELVPASAHFLAFGRRP
jgi:ubiquinone/menaquinone biosynthesis C-methylase UbiE